MNSYDDKLLSLPFEKDIKIRVKLLHAAKECQIARVEFPDQKHDDSGHTKNWLAYFAKYNLAAIILGAFLNTQVYVFPCFCSGIHKDWEDMKKLSDENDDEIIFGYPIQSFNRKYLPGQYADQVLQAGHGLNRRPTKEIIVMGRIGMLRHGQLYWKKPPVCSLVQQLSNFDLKFFLV